MAGETEGRGGRQVSHSETRGQRVETTLVHSSISGDGEAEGHMEG